MKNASYLHVHLPSALRTVYLESSAVALQICPDDSPNLCSRERLNPAGKKSVKRTSDPLGFWPR